MLKQGEFAHVNNEKIVMYLSGKPDYMTTINFDFQPEKGIRPFYEYYSYASMNHYTSMIQPITEKELSDLISDKTLTHFTKILNIQRSNDLSDVLHGTQKTLLILLQNQRLQKLSDYASTISEYAKQQKDPLSDIIDVFFEPPNDEFQQKFLLQPGYSFDSCQSSIKHPVEYVSLLNVQSVKPHTITQVKTIIERYDLKTEFEEKLSTQEPLKHFSIHTITQNDKNVLDDYYKTIIIENPHSKYQTYKAY